MTTRAEGSSHALVAQWIERLRPKEGVGGSIPSQGIAIRVSVCLFPPMRRGVRVVDGAALEKP